MKQESYSRYLRLSVTIVSIAVISLVATSCGQDGGEEIVTPVVVVKPRVGGFVQFGPYLTDGTITASELKSDLTPGARIFSNKITNNSGAYGFNDPVNEFAYAEFSAEGNFYNAITGANSDGKLKLYALTDRSKTGAVNVNMMTHLERDRVKFLVGKGLTFTNAKTQASREVLNVFFIVATQIAETLDIAVKDDQNARLLAFTLIIQSGRTTSEINSLLTNISDDIKEDGILNNDALRFSLQTTAQSLKTDIIRKNLTAYYRQLNITPAIPHFESYAYEFSGQGPSRATVRDINNRSYRTALIGSQWWMVDNLKIAKFPNGEDIANGNLINGDDNLVLFFTRDAQGGNPGNTDDLLNYGYFYSKAAILNGKAPSAVVPSGVQGVCPNGWHVPSTAEFDILLDHLESRGYSRTLDIPNNEAGINLVKNGWRGYDIWNWGVVNIDWAFKTTDGSVTSKSAPNAAMSVRCVKN